MKHQSSLPSLFIALCAVLIIILSSCEKNSVFMGEVANFTSSTDTLTFDTVFTEVGSATRYFKLYNSESSAIFVDVALVNAEKSMFRINVDGTSGIDFKNVRIPANDSIYVFADVTVDPNKPVTVSPFVISENLRVMAKGSEKTVVLEAWGQNANYIPGPKQNGLQTVLSCDFGQFKFDDPKPYVIYGLLLIDECEVVLPAGTQVYVHGGIARTENDFYSDGIVLVGKNGKLTSNGTPDNPVVIQGDRLEEKYDNRAGQWGGIRFLAESKNSTLNHTIIKNSIVGVRVDSLANLELNGCIIKNTSSDGLLGIHSEIYGKNTLIHDNGTQSVTLVFGGNYNFDYCTFANYGGAKTSALLMSNWFKYSDTEYKTNDFAATFKNVIIAGDDNDEILIQESVEAKLSYSMEHTVVRVKDILKAEAYPDFFDNCTNCLQLMDRYTLFVSTKDSEGDYHLDSLSFVEGKAVPLFGIDADLDGNQRDALTPDIGCYEYQY